MHASSLRGNQFILEHLHAVADLISHNTLEVLVASYRCMVSRDVQYRLQLQVAEPHTTEKQFYLNVTLVGW